MFFFLFMINVATMNSIADSPPFKITIFKGPTKPKFQGLMQDCIDQLLLLAYDTTTAVQRGYYVKLRVIRADTPARHYAKGTTHHSGYSSCERCVVVGVQSASYQAGGPTAGGPKKKYRRLPRESCTKENA